MSTNGNLEDLKLLRVQVMEDVGADDQIWIYQEGCIKCRVSIESCTDICLTVPGAFSGRCYDTVPRDLPETNWKVFLFPMKMLTSHIRIRVGNLQYEGNPELIQQGRDGSVCSEP